MMKVNMNKYKRVPKALVHFELKEAMSFESFSFITTLIAGVVTYWVRIFSYSDAGPWYAASAVISITGFYFFKILLKRIGTGKKSVHYRREYAGVTKLFSLYRSIYTVSWGVFLGNVVYYFSRFRIWNDSEELTKLFLHTINPVGLLIGAAISGWVFFYSFMQEPFIESSDYTRRMRYKMNEGRLMEKQAFLEIRQEQDNFHEYGQDYKPEKKAEKVNEIAPRRTEVEENDPYASARIKRGE